MYPVINDLLTKHLQMWRLWTKNRQNATFNGAYFAIHAWDSFDPLAAPAKQPGFCPLKADILRICITH
jgi:hypothetical protein